MDGFYHYDHKRSGVAAVEMAICLPFLLITVIGIIQFYRIVQVQQIINNAAKEGCKAASHGFTTGANGLSQPVMIDDVKDTVFNCIRSNWNTNHNFIFQTTVTFYAIDSVGSITSSSKHPYQFSKGERYMVEVSTPYDAILFSSYGINVIYPLGVMKAKATMACLANKAVSITPSQTLMPRSFQ